MNGILLPSLTLRFSSRRGVWEPNPYRFVNCVWMALNTPVCMVFALEVTVGIGDTMDHRIAEQAHAIGTQYLADFVEWQTLHAGVGDKGHAIVSASVKYGQHAFSHCHGLHNDSSR